MVPTFAENNAPFPLLSPRTISPLAPQLRTPPLANLTWQSCFMFSSAAFSDGLSPYVKFCCLEALPELTEVLLPTCQHRHSLLCQLSLPAYTDVGGGR